MNKEFNETLKELNSFRDDMKKYLQESLEDEDYGNASFLDGKITGIEFAIILVEMLRDKNNDFMETIKNLISYRDRISPTNFQLEKLDDYINQLKERSRLEMKFLFELEIEDEENQENVSEQLKDWFKTLDVEEALESVLSEQLGVDLEKVSIFLQGFDEYHEKQIEDFIYSLAKGVE